MNKKLKNLLKQQDDGFYHLDDILEKNARYNMIFGERSSGKTYACLKYALEQYVKDGSQFAYLRREQEDFKGKRGASIFDALTANGVIEELTDGEYNGVYYWSSRFYFTKIDNEKGTRVNSPEPIGYCFALSTMEHDKSTSYPGINNIIFDEFLTRTTYLVDEFVIFCNVLSTIIRHRDNVKIFLLGNTVNQYCPYFKEMGLKNVKKMEPGQIDLYEYGESGLRVAVEYTGGTRIKSEKPSDVYFAFDNPKLNMIKTGDWELDIYPHCPLKYRPMDVIFTFFIEFDDELCQCDVVKQGNIQFGFIHRKTTPIQDEYRDLIYQQAYDPRRNYRRNLLKPYDNIGKAVLQLFVSDSIYYQDNEVGDLIMNYLQWCDEQSLK